MRTHAKNAGNSGHTANAGGAIRASDTVARVAQPRLQTDLHNVWIHDDTRSRQRAAAQGARAFTYGRDVLLGPGESRQDLGLLTHELAHVDQQLRAGMPFVQRKGLEPGAPNPLEKEADELSQSVTERSTAAPMGFIVDDGSAVREGQLQRRAFLDQLRAAVSDTARAALGPEWSPLGCPYIDRWFERHNDDSASSLERLAQRFAGEQVADSAIDYIAPICVRLRSGIERWRAGEDVNADLTDAGISEDTAQAVQGKAVPGQAFSNSLGPGALMRTLGPGKRLDAQTMTRFGSAMGTSFEHVRVHADMHAAFAADQLHALAFAVGPHIGFARGAYQPNTLEGDALLAHELAHTLQQRNARSSPDLAAAGSAPRLEADADRTAMAAVARLHGLPLNGELAQWETRPQLGSGLSLRRCSNCGTSPAPAIIPLPPVRSGQRDCAGGRFEWRLAPYGNGSAEIWLTFRPNASVGGRRVTFVQTVLQTRGGSRTYAEDDTESRRFEAGSDSRRVDQFLRYGTPFYGTHPDATGGWQAEESTTDRDAGRRNAPSTATDPAYLYDQPMLNSTPTQRFEEQQTFETAAVVMETGQVLGVLRWGLANHTGPPYRELLGAQATDCTETVSTDFTAALNQFYTAKFETIVEGFTAEGTPLATTLSPTQQGALASTVSRLTSNGALRVQLGGAGDLSEPHAQDLGLQRATAVKRYLMDHGIAETRIDIVSYGSSWARVPTTPGASEPRNRRVQVWILT